MTEPTPEKEPAASDHNPSLDRLSDDRSLSKKDLRRFGTVTAVLIAMLFLALANKNRKEMRRQGEASTSPTKYQSLKKPIRQFRLRISQSDMLNVQGEALTHAVDMILRDRQNYHDKTHRDREDENDIFFTTEKKRAHWRKLIAVDAALKSTDFSRHPLVLVSVYPQRVIATLSPTPESASPAQ